jgi:hypothetical protein
MPHALWELHDLLQRATAEQRHVLGKLIAAPYGSAPQALCDHISFLCGGAIGQFFARDYKQLVTDIADRIKLDWSHLAPSPERWRSLTSFEIERAIVDTIKNDKLTTEDIDIEEHIPESIELGIREFTQMVLYWPPYVWIAGSVIDRGLHNAMALLATDWQKLLAAILYTHLEIRRSVVKEVNQSMKPTPHSEISSACLPRHPAVAYLYLVRPRS